MEAGIEEKIIDILPEMRSQKHILMWSCGADSIAAHLRLLDSGIKPELVYMYFIDNLPLVQNYIDYYEKKLSCHIHKLPHPFFWKAFENGHFQTPGVGLPFYKYIKSLHWGRYNFKTFNDALRSNFPDYLFAQGLRASDSINRRLTIKNKGVQNGDTWYPIASYGFNDIKNILNEHDLKLPLDYALFGRSFEGVDPWMAPIIKRECPKTWGMLLDFFPLLNLRCGQAEAMDTSIPNGARMRIDMYRGLPISKRGLVW